MAITPEKPYDPKDDEAKYAHLLGDKEATPPKRSPGRPRSTATPVNAGPSLDVIESSISDFYTLAGGIVGAMPNQKAQIIGGAISQQAEQCAKSIVEAAKNDPKLRKALQKMFRASAYSGIVVAHLPIAMAVYMALMMPTPSSEPVEPEDESSQRPYDAMFFPKAG